MRLKFSFRNIVQNSAHHMQKHRNKHGKKLWKENDCITFFYETFPICITQNIKYNII